MIDDTLPPAVTTRTEWHDTSSTYAVDVESATTSAAGVQNVA